MSDRLSSRLRSTTLRVVLACTCVLLSASMVSAAVVDMDLLGGLGDFERGGTFYWASHGYPGTDSFWDTSTDEWHRETSYTWGYSRCRPNDSVAIGWRRVTGSTVNPVLNTVYRLVAGEGISGTRCQYFAIRAITSGSAYAQLLAPHFVVNSSPYDLHPGDQVKFRIDHIRMSGYDDVPAGTYVAYKLRLSWDGGSAEKTLPKSATPVPLPHNEVVCTIPPGVSRIRACILIETSGNLGSAEPGVYVDGARLLVTRSGRSEYEKEIVPIEPNRRIKTSRLFLRCSSNSDIYFAARSYDYVMLDEFHAADALRLKYYNPGIKIHLYLLTNIRDGRFDPTRERLCSANAVELLSVMTGHTDWLYPYSQYPYQTPDTRSPAWRRLAYKFESAYPESPTYYTRLANRDFQTAWVQGAIAKAAMNVVDGIWVDTLWLVPWDMPERGAGEPQSFVQAVIPPLRSAGLSVVVNSCSEHLEPQGDADTEGLRGASKANPWWQPTTSQQMMGYTPNSPSVTADGVQQEYAFFKPAAKLQPSIVYGDGSYWLRCLADMDAVKRWNEATGSKALAANERRWLHMQATAMKAVPEPAYGLDGWVRYALCSYLLAQNEWTTFGCAFHPSYEQTESIDLDASVTKRLGTPSGEHLPYGGDTYLRYRVYAADSEGGVGGVVVVNANSAQREYRLDFDAVDEMGQSLPSGTVITLKPHTGRILLRSQQISLSVEAPDRLVKPGEEVTLTVTFRNGSASDVENCVVQVKVPDGMDYSEGSAEASGGSYNPVRRTVGWVVGRIPANGSGTRLFRARAR
jgi:uncharacterized repeat protein (TIGR01451 family)